MLPILANEYEKSDRGKPGLAQVERQLKRQIQPAYSLQPPCTIVEGSRTTSSDRLRLTHVDPAGYAQKATAPEHLPDDPTVLGGLPACRQPSRMPD